jgi:hypothetical protein
MTNPILRPGRAYVIGPDGEVSETDLSPNNATVRICRRVVDFPNGVIDARASRAACTGCGVEIAVDLSRGPTDAAAICWQCAGMTPLNFPDGIVSKDN